MTPARVAGLIAHLPDGLTEIYIHPATGPYPGSAPGYQYGAELAALTDPALTAPACRAATSGWADLATSDTNKIKGLRRRQRKLRFNWHPKGVLQVRELELIREQSRFRHSRPT